MTSIIVADQSIEGNGGYREVFANRPFLALWLAQVLSQIADNFLYFVLIVTVYKQTGSNTAVSGLVLAFTIPALTLGLLAGVLVDRVDKRSVLLFSNLARAVTAVAFIFLANNFISVIILGLLTSAVRQLFMPAEAAAMPRLLKPRELLTANALFTLTYNASFIVGFAGAGPLLKFAGTDSVFIVAAVFFMVASALCAWLPSISPEPRVGLPPAISRRIRLVAFELWEGWRFLSHDRTILRTMLQLAFAWSLSGVTAAIAPGFATTVLGLSEEDAFLLVVPAGLGVVLGSILVGKYGGKVNRDWLIAAGLLGMGIAVILLATYRRIIISFFSQLPLDLLGDLHPGGVSGFVVAVMIFAALLGMSNATTVIPANTTIQQGTPDDLRGRVFSVLNALSNLGSTAPVLFVGVIADLIGVGALMLLIGLVIFSVGIVSTIPLLRTRVDTSQGSA